MPKPKSEVTNALIGAAGVHFVVSELSRRGLIALPTIRNTAGIDVVVVSADGNWHANLQVKTSRRQVNFWPIGKNYASRRGRNDYFAFVRYLEKEGRFEVFLESGRNVAEQAARKEQRKQRRGTPGIGPSWHIPNDEKGRERLRKRWQEFGI